MLYVTLDSDYQVIIKGSINGKKVSPFVYGELEYDEGCGYLFKPREDYPWDCCTHDEETALAMIERAVNEDYKEENKMTKEEFLKQIVDGIKAGRLDPCNGVEFGEIYTDRPQYYWTVEEDKVTEESPFYTEDEQPEFRFGLTVAEVEGYYGKNFGELSDDEIKQALLDIIDEYGVDDWYDQYQQEV